MRIMKKVRAWAKQILGLEGKESLKPLAVKALIPSSWFTKKGPGVEAQARKAFSRMSFFQRRLAVAKGWFPTSWLGSLKHGKR